MMRTLALDHVEFEIFDDLEFDDDNGTLVVRSLDSDATTLRCSVTSVFRNGAEVIQAAEKEISKLAAEHGRDCQMDGEKYFFSILKPSSGDSRDTLYLWHVGLGGHLAIVSVFLDHRFPDDQLANRLVECGNLIVRSFRRSSE